MSAQKGWHKFDENNEKKNALHKCIKLDISLLTFYNCFDLKKKNDAIKKIVNMNN